MRAVLFQSVFPIRHSWLPVVERADAPGLSILLADEGLPDPAVTRLVRQRRYPVDSDLFLEKPGVRFRIDPREVNACALPGAPDLRYCRAEWSYVDFGYSFLELTERVPFEDAATLARRFAAYQAYSQRLFHVLWRATRDPDAPRPGVVDVLTRLDRRCREALAAAGLERIPKPGGAATGVAFAESYSDAAMLIGVAPDDPGAEALAREFAGSPFQRGDIYHADLAWSVGYTATVATCRTRDSLGLAREVLDRSMVAWSIYDDIASQMKGLARLSMVGARDYGTMETSLRFWRRFSGLVGLHLVPSQVGSWSTNLAFYRTTWERWNTGALHEIVTVGATEVVQIVTEEVTIARTRLERRLQLVATVISVAVILGLCAQIVEYVGSNDPPETPIRLFWLVVSTLALLASAAWLLVLGRPRPK